MSAGKLRAVASQHGADVLRQLENGGDLQVATFWNTHPWDGVEPLRRAEAYVAGASGVHDRRESDGAPAVGLRIGL